jgi:glyceraldehyde 3-phosphate dehydrogenase
MVNVGINGFGRIGRMVLRASFDPDKKSKIKITAINDPALSPEYMVYLLKYDSAQGRFHGDVEIVDNGKALKVNGNKITLFKQYDPEWCDWSSCKVDYVAECSGFFLDRKSAGRHFALWTGTKEDKKVGKETTVKRVVISAPPKDDIPMYVMGVNHDKLSKCDQGGEMISNASCTTNCLGPVAKVLHDKFTILEGLMTTVHAVTANQTTVDGPSPKRDQWQMGRGAYSNIIASTTGAAKAIGKVIPSLNGKMDGMSFRVPVPTGSVVDLTVRTEKDCGEGDQKDKDQVIEAMKEAASGSMKGFLKVVNPNEPIVSSDVIGDSASSLFDGANMNRIYSKGVDGKKSCHFLKIVSWYDNEWGYSNRMVDLILAAAGVDGTK